MAAEVIIYTTPICPYCVSAKALLARKGAAYRELDVAGDDEKRRWLRDATGQRTVPQIFIGGVPIGGYTDMVALDRAGRLDAMLAGEGPGAPQGGSGA